MKGAISLNLFRIPFIFRELNPVPLQYLQIVPRLSSLWESTNTPHVRALWLRLFETIKNGLTEENPKFSIKMKVDIENDLWFFPAIIERAKYFAPEL